MTAPAPYRIETFTAHTRPEAFEAAIALRRAVFVDDEGRLLADEPDTDDTHAVHWLIRCQDTGECLGTSRLVEYQEGCQTRPIAKLGRIAVSAARRGEGLGRLLVQSMVGYARDNGYPQAYLHAQSHAQAFYQKIGFEAEGDEFLEAGIPHVAMRSVL